MPPASFIITTRLGHVLHSFYCAGYRTPCVQVAALYRAGLLYAGAPRYDNTRRHDNHARLLFVAPQARGPGLAPAWFGRAGRSPGGSGGRR